MKIKIRKGAVMKKVTFQKVERIDVTYSILLIIIFVGIAACVVLVIFKVLDLGLAGYIAVGLIFLGGSTIYIGRKHLRRLRNRLRLPFQASA